MLEYDDFSMLVSQDGAVRVSSGQGEVRDRWSLDRNDVDLALNLIEHERTNEELLKALGTTLYRSLFPAGVHAHLRASLAVADVAARGVRLRLILEPPELSALPWEFLYDVDTNTFLANTTQLVLSRFISVIGAKRDLKIVTPPLKILLILSSPGGLPALDAAGEEQLIRNALAGLLTAGQVELDVLTQATIRNISQKLREKPYNVVHFVGHGDFTDEKGQLALVDPNDGTARLVDDEAFSNFFLGNRSMGLVILNACRGAGTSSHRAFVGMAPQLVLRGIPAVIAMQYPIYDTTAKIFTDQFYSTLALGWPIDAAVQSTRNAISMEVGLGRRDFATPVLFMRASDGLILTV
jgi:CHAT domain-containing protein